MFISPRPGPLLRPRDLLFIRDDHLNTKSPQRRNTEPQIPPKSHQRGAIL
ncbi:hypothetical protein FOMPIDRAFT_1054903 [Fomitopsis schrenkii]|uniref:Uncharacterized protein n=1 Tax=Fomitopsis schrenkii TaxID=2126942 RepID=S8EYF0_FOMSC|nr:hypothetical protein FOMPIDRAFT_1054903 [Fomitopsis schrenkii]